jgi:uncharacterized protein YndB with AHSA1/START domain
MAAAILACRSIADVSGAVTRGVFVRVAPERAFEAFVRVSEVLSWLADGAVIGARAGGNWALGWYADPDSDAGYSSMGQIETFEPGRTLAVSNLVFSSPEGLSFGPMRLVITFEAVEEGTDVTVVQEGIEEGPVWESYRDQLGPGWERMLGDLKAWLEEGKKLPGR